MPRRSLLIGEVLNLEQDVVINIKSAPFYAKGNGTDDDTDAITAAYDSLPSDGGALFLPAGTYRISEQLDWSDSRSILVFGAGMGASTILVTGAAMGSSPDYGAIKLSKLLAGMKTLRDFTIRRATSGVLANDNGVVLGPVQNMVNLDSVEMLFMGNNGFLHLGNSANVTLRNCNIRGNSSYGVNALGSSAAVQNFLIDGCSIYGNAGGINVATNFRTVISNNDIEGDDAGVAQSLPMLNITGSDVTLSGNTSSLSATATATQVAVFDGEGIVSVGDHYSINDSGQTAISIGATARNIEIIAPQLSAPVAPGGTGVTITTSADMVRIVAPNFGNTFTNRIVNNGNRTTIDSNTTDAIANFFQNVLWGNGKGELTTTGLIQLNVADRGIANAAGDTWLRAPASTGNIRFQDLNGTDSFSLSLSSGLATFTGSIKATLQTTTSGLAAGTFWNDGGTVKVV